MKRPRDGGSGEGHWNPRALSEETKAWVRTTLTKKAKATGGISVSSVAQLVKLTTLRDRLGGIGMSMADLVWSWVAECQERRSPLLTEEVHRHTQAGNIRPAWRWYAMVRSGWRRPSSLTQEVVEQRAAADRVMAALLRHQENMSWQQWVDQEEQQVLYLEKGTVRAAWMSVKTTFKGPGGYRRFMTVIGLLLRLQEIEGGVDEAPDGGGF